MWGCLVKVVLFKPKKRKVGPKTSNCMFMGFASSSVTYRFIVFKSNALDYNTIIEIKNAKFFKYIYPLCDKISHTTKPLNTPLFNLEKTNELLKSSKRPRKETSFGMILHIYY